MILITNRAITSAVECECRYLCCISAIKEPTSVSKRSFLKEIEFYFCFSIIDAYIVSISEAICIDSDTYIPYGTKYWQTVTNIIVCWNRRIVLSICEYFHENWKCAHIASTLILYVTMMANVDHSMIWTTWFDKKHKVSYDIKPTAFIWHSFDNHRDNAYRTHKGHIKYKDNKTISRKQGLQGNIENQTHNKKKTVKEIQARLYYDFTDSTTR